MIGSETELKGKEDTVFFLKFPVHTLSDLQVKFLGNSHFTSLFKTFLHSLHLSFLPLLLLILLIFSSDGVSSGQYANEHLVYVRLNSDGIPWTSQDFTYLQQKNYDENLITIIQKSVKFKDISEVQKFREENLVFVYHMRDREITMKNFGVMSDEKVKEKEKKKEKKKKKKG